MEDVGQNADLYIANQGTNYQQKSQRLKISRNQIFKQIRKRAQQLNEVRVEQLATEMEANKGNRKVFEIARVLSKHQDSSFSLYGKSHERMHEVTEIIKAVTRHYSKFFARDGATPLPQWRGEPRELTKIITGAEVTEAAKRLRNNRALGPDDVAEELIKYGGEKIHEELAKTYNGIFEKHEKVAELNEGGRDASLWS